MCYVLPAPVMCYVYVLRVVYVCACVRQVRMDERILHLSEPELESIKIINGQPTLIVSFETHQL